MDASWSLILDLAISLGTAVILGVLCEKVGISSVVGYLIAGVAVGPGALGLVKSGEAVRAIAEIGVALLLFTIGLEFSFQRLRRMGGRVLLGATLAVCATVTVGMIVAIAAGLSWQASLGLGMVVSLSSTAMVLRILKDRNDLDAKHGRTALAVLLVQDVAVVPLVLGMTFLSSGDGNILADLGLTLTRALALVSGLFAFAVFVVPRLLDARLVARNRELPILLAITSCVGATFVAHVIGISPALGAFAAGLMLAETRFADQMRADVLPLRTLFLTVFFVSVGLLADVGWIADNILLVLGVSMLVIIAKSAITFFMVRPFVPGIIECLATGIAVSQIGEFSFVLATIGVEGGLFSDSLFQLIVSTSLITFLATPFLTAHALPIARFVAIKLVPTKKLAQAERSSRNVSLADHVIVIGFGEAGQVAAEVVAHAELDVLVIDISPALVQMARTRGYHVLLGDATQSEILEHAGLHAADSVILAIPDPNASRIIISQCKVMAPDVPIVARVRYHVTCAELTVLGADILIDEELRVGQHLGESMLEHRAMRQPLTDELHILR